MIPRTLRVAGIDMIPAPIMQVDILKTADDIDAPSSSEVCVIFGSRGATDVVSFFSNFIDLLVSFKFERVHISKSLNRQPRF